MIKIHDYEVSDRVALLKRLKGALRSQRDKFRAYLDVLERQEEDILARDVEKLESHVDLEQSIVKEIYAFQKVIDPLKDMYNMAYPSRGIEVPELEATLEHLRSQVIDRNQKNQDLLKNHMFEIKREIADLRSRKRRKFASQPEPTLIDITT